MYRILKNKQKGFTLIELMIVVAIIGILAAVAIPQFLKMMAKSKTGEAQLTLDLVKKAEKAQWTENTGYVTGAGIPLPSTGSVGNGCCDNADRKCANDPDEWNDPASGVWADLDVRLDQPGYFVYTYSSADGTAMSAFAYGNLNCNASTGSYDLEGAEDAAGGPVFALAKPGATVTNGAASATGATDE
jgi:prepilin-type N-terminal cleavage/methylation domain-containing protein